MPLSSLLSSCTLCPRRCRVNRTQGALGFCRAGAAPRLALVCLHQWEEPCLSGTHGAGTVFFSHCSLRCCFCQNYKISHGGYGQDITVARLAAAFLEQQRRGAHNIDLVTPTHFVPQIIAALARARAQGLSLPVVYNSSGYETVETIALLQGWVDIFLPDLKYFDDTYAVKYSQAPDYFAHASAAIKKMAEIAGPPVFDAQGLLQKGVIVRHLALPGLAPDSRHLLDWLWHTFGHSVYVSLMSQYTPVHRAAVHPELNRTLTQREYDELVDYAISLGIENGFIQDGRTATTEFIPPFDLSGVNPPAATD